MWGLCQEFNVPSFLYDIQNTMHWYCQSADYCNQKSNPLNIATYMHIYHLIHQPSKPFSWNRYGNWPNAQAPQTTWLIFYNVPFVTETCITLVLNGIVWILDRVCREIGEIWYVDFEALLVGVVAVSAHHITSTFGRCVAMPDRSKIVQHDATTNISLTLNVRGPGFLGLTRSISWLLMPWLLTSPGHQQPWYWLCKICRCWSYLKKVFKYLCQINVE